MATPIITTQQLTPRGTKVLEIEHDPLLVPFGSFLQLPPFATDNPAPIPNLPQRVSTKMEKQPKKIPKTLLDDPPPIASDVYGVHSNDIIADSSTLLATQHPQQQQPQHDQQPHSPQGSPRTHQHAQLEPDIVARLDEIFFQFLNNLCSNLDATDSKGEKIHQTLMAKKMQKLDESPDFRPFKFRIQAFVNAFHEELIRNGFTEDLLPLRKVKIYLWKSRFISRFNEDGKKAKSKGNHVWNIEAKKIPSGGWVFREFTRKIAGPPPKVAYIGLKYQWAPRVWDPQMRSPKVVFHSPYLPDWLRWENNLLTGTPGIDAENCEITAIAHYYHGDTGQLYKLEKTFFIQVAHLDTVDLPVVSPFSLMQT
ncbi:hypothetical protein BC938DRAFT_475206 [Jimgerdemannia flammicorona]|uniref:Uncharacterized protein n=1 Tax=Jimgerdemannia flammicorona TaxID=994334 RepID=A0A433PYU9_9FUNG|nr:hypothetical protein BC938DRAFT_475206 [Jimgerdemannia flammicorona]